MTADMAAVERMLKADAAGGKKGPNSAPTRPSGTSFGSKEPEEQETLEPSGDGGTERFQRPAPGSEEELAVMQAAWADENFRKAFYQQYGDKLEAAGIPCDGTFPGMQQLSQIPGQDPNGPRGLTITPEPGFVIKTKTLETNEKVFINFCKSVLHRILVEPLTQMSSLPGSADLVLLLCSGIDLGTCLVQISESALVQQGAGPERRHCRSSSHPAVAWPGTQRFGQERRTVCGL